MWVQAPDTSSCKAHSESKWSRNCNEHLALRRHLLCKMGREPQCQRTGWGRRMVLSPGPWVPRMLLLRPKCFHDRDDQQARPPQSQPPAQEKASEFREPTTSVLLFTYYFPAGGFQICLVKLPSPHPPTPGLLSSLIPSLANREERGDTASVSPSDFTDFPCGVSFRLRRLSSGTGVGTFPTTHL